MKPKLFSFFFDSPRISYLHTFELYQISGRIHLFGADTPDSVQQWIETIAKVSSFQTHQQQNIHYEMLGTVL